MLELSLILCCCYYPATQRIILMKMYDVENFRLSCLFYSIIFCFEARLFGGFSLLLFFLFTSICFSIIFKWYRASERWMEWEGGNFLILKMLLQNPIFTLTSDDSLFCLFKLVYERCCVGLETNWKKLFSRFSLHFLFFFPSLLRALLITTL